MSKSYALFFGTTSPCHKSDENRVRNRASVCAFTCTCITCTSTNSYIYVDVPELVSYHPRGRGLYRFNSLGYRIIAAVIKPLHKILSISNQQQGPRQGGSNTKSIVSHVPTRPLPVDRQTTKTAVTKTGTTATKHALHTACTAPKSLGGNNPPPMPYRDECTPLVLSVDTVY